MTDSAATTHLSIGEVLGLLVDEFPDVTISKIRFLESQGLIEPERTPSGYRKFYEPDVELLRIILREQREKFLPLRVIKDRIVSGEIEPPPGANATPPRGAARPAEPPSTHPTARAASPAPPSTADETTMLSRDALAPTPPETPRPAPGRADAAPAPAAPRLLPGVLVTAPELCTMAGITLDQLSQLVEFGVVTRHKGSDLFADDAVEIATTAGGFIRSGIDARHLRAWRTSVEREVGLYEQLITPLLRQRNGQGRAQAVEQLTALQHLGAKFRAALVRSVTSDQIGL